MSISTFVLAALLTLPLPLQSSVAGCGTTPSLEAAADSAAAAFVGQARNISPTSENLVFDVDWQWKGIQIPATVEVHVAAADGVTSSAASRTFAAGHTYLVFTDNADPPFSVDQCSGSIQYGDGSVIPPNLWEALGSSEPTLPVPIEVETQSRPPTFSAMGAAALVGITIFLLARTVVDRTRRRREQLARGNRPHKMSRSDRSWLAEQEQLEAHKPTSGDRELQKLREVWRRNRKKSQRAAAKERVSVDA